MTIVEWIDILSRKEQREIIMQSLKYCIAEKGLNVYSYCVMTNHVHMIVNCNEPFQLKDTIRDFKKYTSKAIISEIKNGVESRRDWMLELFQKAGSDSTKNKTYKVWQTGNHAIELFSEKFTWEKVDYIHQNPVKAGFVLKPEDWKYSSASNYAKLEDTTLKEVIPLSSRVITVS